MSPDPCVGKFFFHLYHFFFLKMSHHLYHLNQIIFHKIQYLLYVLVLYCRFFSIDEQLACYCGFPRCRGVVNDIDAEEQLAKLYVSRSELRDWRGE